MRACSVVLFAAVLAAFAHPAEPPPSRLYVRTIPPGARIILDGKELGLSDGLFIVLPGDHTVTLELDDYQSEKREVNVAPERITRLVVTLVERAEANPPPGAPAPIEAAAALVARAKVPEAERAAMQTVLRQHPTQTRWSGRSATRLFAVAARALPTGDIR